MNVSLSGLTVVNTRPVHQAGPLSELVSTAGGSVIELPVIEIQPVTVTSELQTQLARLTKVNLAVFISVNAVETGITALGGAQHWPDNVAIAAVGRATAAKCQSLGLNVSLVSPEPYNSEALLTLPEFQNLTGKSVTIFRGEGGREFLATTLRERGAEVEYIESYRRILPESDPVKLYECWDRKCVLLIVVTSNQALQNLVKLVSEKYRDDLLTTTLVVVSQRAISMAKELGFKIVPELTLNASNESIMETILHWYGNRINNS